MNIRVAREILYQNDPYYLQVQEKAELFHSATELRRALAWAVREIQAVEEMRSDPEWAEW